jgi:hypothetical protein
VNNSSTEGQLIKELSPNTRQVRQWLIAVDALQLDAPAQLDPAY